VCFIRWIEEEVLTVHVRLRSADASTDKDIWRKLRAVSSTIYL
jgi:hypothetical protein